MKAQPSLCVLSAVAAAGALLLGCEGGIKQIAPGPSAESELIAAYVDPISPAPAGLRRGDGGDGDKLPQLDGDAQDKEWNVAKPLYVYVSGDKAVGGPGFYVELRAIWSDENHYNGDTPNYLYMLVRYGDETFDILPDYWRYARPGALGLIPSPTPEFDRSSGACDTVIVTGKNWYVENTGMQEDMVCLMFEKEPAGDENGSYSDLGCLVACHASGSSQFGRVPKGKLDVWVWRAGRTNAQESTIYPDLGNVDPEGDGRPASQYPRLDTSTFWPAYLEDMVADAQGLRNDANDPNYAYRKTGYAGQLWARNASTQRSRDAFPIPSFITELAKEPPKSTGGPTPPVEPVNGGLPTPFYLWGPTAKQFSLCDTIATSRIGNRKLKWSERLGLGETDVMPGYVLWVPSGSAADVRAKGNWVSNAQKRFPVWSLEIRRPLIPGFPALPEGNPDDLAMDPDKEYVFTIAIFDRSSTVHSGSGPLKLKFQPSLYATKPGPAAGEAF